MIIKIECNSEERAAIRAMAQKNAIKSLIIESSKVITPKGEDTVEIKPALIVVAAKLVEVAAPLLTSVLCNIKTTVEVLQPYIKAVKEAAEEEE